MRISSTPSLESDLPFFSDRSYLIYGRRYRQCTGRQLYHSDRTGNDHHGSVQHLPRRHGRKWYPTKLFHLDTIPARPPAWLAWIPPRWPASRRSGAHRHQQQPAGRFDPGHNQPGGYRRLSCRFDALSRDQLRPGRGHWFDPGHRQSHFANQPDPTTADAKLPDQSHDQPTGPVHLRSFAVAGERKPLDPPGGSTPSTSDTSLDPTSFQSAYLANTSFATANCLIHTGELYSTTTRLPAPLHPHLPAGLQSGPSGCPVPRVSRSR